MTCLLCLCLRCSVCHCLLQKVLAAPEASPEAAYCSAGAAALLSGTACSLTRSLPQKALAAQEEKEASPEAAPLQAAVLVQPATPATQELDPSAAEQVPPVLNAIISKPET